MASTVQNTTLSFGMLSIPVALCKVEDKKDVTLDRAAKVTEGEGKAAKTSYHSIGRPDLDLVTEKKVESTSVVHGVWQEDGSFREVPKESLEAIKEATVLDAYEIAAFVPVKDIPWDRATGTYFLAPQKSAKGPGGIKAMALLAAAMKAKKVAGVAKITKRSGGNQYLAVIYAQDSALLVTTLAWSEDWTAMSEAQVLDGVAVEKAHVEAAKSVIEALTTDAVNDVLDAQSDAIRPLKARLIAEAQSGKPIAKKSKKDAPVLPEPAGDPLLAQLEASLAAATK